MTMSSPDTDMLATRPVAERKVVAMSESMRLITAPPPYALYQARVASPAMSTRRRYEPRFDCLRSGPKRTCPIDSPPRSVLLAALDVHPAG
jgi:hypothetical protein